MKPSNLMDKQRVLVFIPLLNFFVIFMFLFNFIKTGQYKEMSAERKVARTSLKVIIPIAIVYIVLSKVLSGLAVAENVLCIVTAYVLPLLWGRELLRIQRADAEQNTQKSCNHEPGEKKTSIFKTKRFFVCLVVVLLVVMVVFAASMLTSADSIEDLNGTDDHTVVAISLDDMLTTIDDYSAFFSATSVSGEHSQVAGELSQHDYDGVTYRSKKISGVKTLHATNIQRDTLVLEIDSELSSGNMEMVVLVDEEYYCHVEAGCLETVVIEDVANKTVVVRMAAESAEVEISVARK